METKNSGDNITYEGGAKRENKSGKLRFDLIPVDQLKRLAGVYTRGAEIYGERNMEKGNMDYAERCKQSAYRHFISWIEGDYDEDHGMQCVWNIFTYEFLKDKNQLSHMSKMVMKEYDEFMGEPPESPLSESFDMFNQDDIILK